MVGIILVSENSEAAEMLKTVRRLLGRTRGIMAVVLKPGEPVEKMHQSIKRAITQVDRKKGVLILTDFYGSTQCNVCLRCLKKGSVELLTGFNLPMLVKLGSVHETLPFKDLIRFIERYGRDHIRHVRAPAGRGLRKPKRFL